MSEFDLVAESREDVGKGASRRLRRAGKVPGIVYGAGKNPAMIALTHTDLEKNLAQESFYSKVLNLKVGSKRKEKVVLNDIQRDPARPRVLHVDFQRVKATEALRMRVPLHFLGEEEAPGVRLQHGIPTHRVTDVEVECLPANLPEYIDVDVSKLEIGDVIRLSGLAMPEKVVLVDLVGFESMDEDEREAADQPVVSIQPPVAEEVPEAAEAEEAVGEVPAAPAEEQPSED